MDMTNILEKWSLHQDKGRIRKTLKNFLLTLEFYNFMIMAFIFNNLRHQHQFLAVKLCLILTNLRKLDFNENFNTEKRWEKSTSSHSQNCRDCICFSVTLCIVIFLISGFIHLHPNNMNKVLAYLALSKI